jgi:glycosyltransferase involved in cell wall biosynthesis
VIRNNPAPTSFWGAHCLFELARLRPDCTFWLAGYCYQADPTILEFDTYRYVLAEYPNVKFWGYANPQLRRKLLTRASALIQLSQYPEPFGFNVIEAYLSGTPVLTSATGTFRETVEQGITGFRCQDVAECATYLDQVTQLDSRACSNKGLAYTAPAIYPHYRKLFQRLRPDSEVLFSPP